MNNNKTEETLETRIIKYLWGKTIGFNLSVKELAKFIRQEKIKNA